MGIEQQISGVQQDTSLILTFLRQLDRRIKHIEKRLGSRPGKLVLLEVALERMPELGCLPIKILEMPLDEAITDLSVRVRNALHRREHLFIDGKHAGPLRVADLVGKRPEDFLELKGFGKTSWRELSGKLHRLMIEFTQDT